MNVDDDDNDDEGGTSIATPDGDAVPSLLPHVDIDAPLGSQLAYAVSHVWQRKHELRANQTSAVTKFVYDNTNHGHTNHRYPLPLSYLRTIIIYQKNRCICPVCYET